MGDFYAGLFKVVAILYAIILILWVIIIGAVLTALFGSIVPIIVFLGLFGLWLFTKDQNTL